MEKTKFSLNFVDTNGREQGDMDTDALTREAVALLCQLTETPRTSREEGAACDVVERFVAGHKLHYRRVGNNLIVRRPPQHGDHPTLLLNAHIDTVKPTASWTRDPFKACIEGDKLYGLGTNDDGASLVCLLQTYRMLDEMEQNYDLVLAISAEEEVSGKDGMESIVPLLGRVDVALVGEPTSMQPAVAEKGLMVLDVTARGKAGHAAREGGENAIYRAMDDMQWFRTYRFPRESRMLGGVKMTVTMVEAGIQHNVIPDLCRFTVDVRTNECYSNREVFDVVRQNVSSEVVARSFRLNSSRIDETHPMVRRAVEMGLKPFGSPTLSDQALMPFPSIKMGPGESSRSHCADEFILISEMEGAIGTYLNLLNGLSIAQD